MSFSYTDIQEAYERIRPYIRETPLEESFYLGDSNQHFFSSWNPFSGPKALRFAAHSISF